MAGAHIVQEIDALLGLLDQLEGKGTGATSKSSSGDKGWPAARVRQTFIDFFCKKHEHLHKPSSPVIPHDDPTLLFANAGMNQFKPIFLGEVDPLSPMATWKRAANSQKCIRAGGKHNDLEDVGKDVYHHTYFEMLGNWSFGNYFKKGAIDMAWELLTEVYGLDPTRLYATYFQGDEKQGVPCDNEARDLWLRYMPKERVLPFDAKDNFWEMGETGPCGPCTELHYDRIGNRMCADLVNMDDPDVLEIWNLVFMQFNRQEDGSLVELPAQHVDTGMGFERITSVLQDKRSNYDTDVFTPIIAAIQEVTGCNTPYRGFTGKDDVDNIDMAYRVVADHIRNLTVAITDGAQPGKQGRNSVLRTVLRRMARYGKLLRENGDKGEAVSYLYKLVPVVVESLGEAFPELTAKVDYVQGIIKMEEEKFYNLLVKGEKKLKRDIKRLQDGGKKVFPGNVVFKYWGSYGFPAELTELIVEEAGMKVHWESYHEEDRKYKEEQLAVEKKAAFRTIQQHEVQELKKRKIMPSNSKAKYMENENFSCKLIAIWDGENFINSVEEGDKQVALILDRTNYYYESGGQINDIGLINKDDDNTFVVDDCQEFNQYVMHIGSPDGSFKLGDKLTCTPDYANRRMILPNHTMTHTLNHALRHCVGNEIDQKGSLNDASRLTFDFNIPKKLTTEQIRAVEEFVNSDIKKGMQVFEKEIKKEDALAISSIRAMFADKYPPVVRVISIGVPLDEVLKNPTDDKWLDYSIELCGGTHLTNTQQAKQFYVISEEAVMEGIRRLYCVTGFEASNASTRANELRNRIAECFKMEGTFLTEELRLIKGAMSQQIPLLMRREFEDELKKLDNIDKKQKKAAAKKLEKIALDKLDSLDTSKPYLLVRVMVRGDGKLIQSLAKALGKNKKFSKTCVLLYDQSPDGKNKVLFKCVVPKAISKKVSAKDCLKEIQGMIDGGSGGSPQNATAQGKDDSKLGECLKSVEAYFKKNLK